eukprot:jgi/Chrpa1/3052/Chrysochromulina_OHIO_Genome00013084-RA
MAKAPSDEAALHFLSDLELLDTATPDARLCLQFGHKYAVGRRPEVPPAGATAVYVRTSVASRMHLLVSQHPTDLWLQGTPVWGVTDLGSMNGTWINGYRLPAHTWRELRHDDVINIGEKSALRWRVEQPLQPPAASHAATAGAAAAAEAAPAPAASAPGAALIHASAYTADAYTADAYAVQTDDDGDEDAVLLLDAPPPAGFPPASFGDAPGGTPAMPTTGSAGRSAVTSRTSDELLADLAKSLGAVPGFPPGALHHSPAAAPPDGGASTSAAAPATATTVRVFGLGLPESLGVLFIKKNLATTRPETLRKQLLHDLKEVIELVYPHGFLFLVGGAPLYAAQEKKLSSILVLLHPPDNVLHLRSDPLGVASAQQHLLAQQQFTAHLQAGVFGGTLDDPTVPLPAGSHGAMAAAIELPAAHETAGGAHDGGAPDDLDSDAVAELHAQEVLAADGAHDSAHAHAPSWAPSATSAGAVWALKKRGRPAFEDAHDGASVKSNKSVQELD